MTNGVGLPGSPCRTASFAPLGIEGGALPHLMSFELMNTSLSLVPWANVGAAMAPKTIAANDIAAFLPDLFMVSISNPATRVTESPGPRCRAIADPLTYSNESTPLMIAN
jgi:hypothetical protein